MTDEVGSLTAKRLDRTMRVPESKSGGKSRNEISGVDKVTALLLTMGKPLADRIVKQFDDRDIRALARAAAALPPVEIEEIDRMVGELARQLESAGAIEGSSSGARALLAGVMPDEEVGEIMGELAGEAPTLIWRKLGNIAEEKLADFISTEQPQVAAQVLSKLDAAKASAIMDKLEPELCAQLSLRLIAMKPIGDTAAKLLAERLGSELLENARSVSTGRNNHALLGGILNKLDREKSKSILDRLLAEDARKVKNYVFGFEDLASLSNEDRARLFEEASTDRVVLALRDCDPALSAIVLSSLSPRARRLIDSELANPVKAPRKAIEEARRSIADLALSLAQRSVIVLSPDASGPP